MIENNGHRSPDGLRDGAILRLATSRFAQGSHCFNSFLRFGGLTYASLGPHSICIAFDDR